MFSISNDKSFKNVKCQFCYSSTMEELMSFHVMAEPELHSVCGDFALHLRENLPDGLKAEIDDIGTRFAHWYYILDLVGLLVEEDANYQCDLEQVAEKLLMLPLMEFSYYVLGLSVDALHISMEEFSQWYLDETVCMEELKARNYDLMELENVRYVLENAGEMKKRLLKVVREYWECCFSKEWATIRHYVREIIAHEEMRLEHTTLSEYLSQFHSQLKMEDEILIFDKKPKLQVSLAQIEALTITPTIFGDSHLHGTVYGSKVNINLNLNYRALQISKEIPESYFQILRAISDESRFKILKVLWNGDATTKEISDILRLSPSTISLHLKLLKDADLVSSRKIKKFVYYQLKKEQLLTIQDQLMNYLKY